MGFLDRARKMAEQAQVKLDEAQQQFNQRPGGAKPGDPPVEYDQHGRPVPPAGGPPPASPGGSSSQPPPAPPPDPAGPPTPRDDAPPIPAPPVAAPPRPAPPAAAPATRSAEDVTPGSPAGGDRDEYAPPKLSDGDPLTS